MADGVGSAAATGALAGAGKGAQLGATIGSVVPGVGNAVGGVVGAVGGAIAGGIGSGKQAQAANQSQQVPLTDPLEAQRLNEINQIRKSISTGTNVQTQAGINQARSIGAQTQNQLVKATGGDVGGTVAALLKAQRGTQAASNQAIVQGQAQNPFFQNLQQQLLTRVSQRKLELGLLNRAQQTAQSAQGLKNATLSGNALLATQGEIPSGGADIISGLLSKIGQGGGQGQGQVQAAPTLVDGTSPGLLSGITAANQSVQPPAPIQGVPNIPNISF